MNSGVRQEVAGRISLQQTTSPVRPGLVEDQLWSAAKRRRPSESDTVIQVVFQRMDEGAYLEFLGRLQL